MGIGKSGRLTLPLYLATCLHVKTAQANNDVLDCRLFDYLSIEINSVITTRKYLEIVNEKVHEIERTCVEESELPPVPPQGYY